MIKVIAETDELLVLDKPAGLIVHSDGRTEEPSVADWILQNYPALEGVGEPWISPQGERVPLPGIVHRLDRTTSGVMLVAKTSAMYGYLKHEFKERRVEKIYSAYVYGRMETKEADSNSSRQGRIVAEIKRSSEPPRRWYCRLQVPTNDPSASPCEENNVRAAITDWKVLKQLEEAAYLEVRPRTGRTHQIRVHLASIGHPVVADHLYAADCPLLLGFTRPALHATSISVALDGKRETFQAPLPLDFRSVEV